MNNGTIIQRIRKHKNVTKTLTYKINIHIPRYKNKY